MKRTDQGSVLQNGDIDEAIEVKREENLNWGYPERHPTTSKNDTVANQGTFGDLVSVPPGTDPSVSALICSERPPGMISSELKTQQTHDPTNHDDLDSSLSLVKSQNASSHSSSPLPPSSPINTTVSSVSTVSSTSDHCLHDELFTSSDSLIKTEHITRVDSSSLDREREIDGAERPMDTTDEDHEHDEAKMDTDSSNSPPPEVKMSTSSSGSGSEKEGSPVQVVEKRCRSKGSRSPDTKRKWRSYETEEEYERRKMARRTNMNFILDFCEYAHLVEELINKACFWFK